LARGGRRQGTPGKAYGNRTDLNGAKPMAVPGQTYGEQKQQLDAQAAIPMARPPAERLADYTGPSPADVPSLLSAPSARPEEPLTAGLASGPGPGPEAIAMARAAPKPGVDDLRAVYAAFPYPGIRRLLDWAEK
jgi:hypothetical protein